ncbi:MAG: hypothetical protein ABS76_24550 [Pelagibacterium sp. SCN 64-44]|nr:MAG: hypothetical protein ABS76_24550 [Pelagibacterium sp. SCN 64-44]
MTDGSRIWLSRALRLGLLAFAAAGLIGSVLYLLKDNPRSFVVQAEARGVTARIDHPAMSQWLLDRAQVCFRRERRAPAIPADQAPDAVCDARLFEVVAAENLEIFWPEKAEIRLNRAGPASPLLITLLGAPEQAVEVAGRPLTSADLVVVESADWLGNSPLTIAGHIVVGSRPGPGETGNLLGGSYAVSERLPLAPAATPIMSGQLLSGDAVEILLRKDCAAATGEQACPDGGRGARHYQPSQSFGFVEPRGADDAGFGVTLYAETSDASLSIDRFGASEIIVTPNWVHRALANPVLLGGSAILAILSGLSSLNFLAPLGLWAWRVRGGKTEAVAEEQPVVAAISRPGEPDAAPPAS